MDMHSRAYDRYDSARGHSQPRLVRFALVIAFWLAIVFYFWPLLNAVKLSKDVAAADIGRIEASIDLAALRNSLSGQVAGELAAQAQPGAGARAIDLPVNATTVATLLSGRLPPELGQHPDRFSALPPLSARKIRRFLSIWWASRFVAATEYQLVVPAADKHSRMLLRFTLSGLSWRLSAIELPQPVAASIARHFAAN